MVNGNEKQKRLYNPESWEVYWPDNMDTCKEFNNLREFYQYIKANNLILVTGIKWGEVAVIPQGKIVTYFKSPKPIHDFMKDKK